MALEGSLTVSNYDHGADDNNGDAASASSMLVHFCWCISLFVILCVVVTFVTLQADSNRHTREKSANGSTSGADGADRRNAASGGREGSVKSFNWCGNHKHMAVLTFDDGPSVTATPNVLRDLQSTGVVGTFFMSPAVDGTPDDAKCALVEKILEEGHAVQSHSWDHVDFANLTDAQVVDNLHKNKDWLTRCAGAQAARLDVNMFRPPYGSLDYARAQYISNELGYTIATWNMETEDFRGGLKHDIVERIRGKYEQMIPDRQGSVVILMHDKTYVEGGSLGAIPLIKEYFDRLGYEFATAAQCYDKCDDDVTFCKMDGVWPGVFEQP